MPAKPSPKRPSKRELPASLQGFAAPLAEFLANKMPKGGHELKGIVKTAWFLQEHPEFRSHPILRVLRANTSVITRLLTYLNQSGAAKVQKGIENLTKVEQATIRRLHAEQTKSGTISINAIAMKLKRGPRTIERYLDSLKPKTEP